MGYFLGDVCLYLGFKPYGNRSLPTCDSTAKSQRYGSQPPPNLPRSSGEAKERSGTISNLCLFSVVSPKFDGPAISAIIAPHPDPLPAGEGTTNLRGRLSAADFLVLWLTIECVPIVRCRCRSTTLALAVSCCTSGFMLHQRFLSCWARGFCWTSSEGWTGGGRSVAKENSAKRYKGIEPDAMRP